MRLFLFAQLLLCVTLCSGRQFGVLLFSDAAPGSSGCNCDGFCNNSTLYMESCRVDRPSEIAELFVCSNDTKTITHYIWSNQLNCSGQPTQTKKIPTGACVPGPWSDSGLEYFCRSNTPYEGPKGPTGKNEKLR